MGKTLLLTVRVSPEDRRRWRKAAGARRLSAWVREVLDAAAKPDLCDRCKRTKSPSCPACREAFGLA